MKVAEYIAEYLQSLGIKYVFGITGSAIADVYDSLRKFEDIDYVCVQHEQAAAMAAEGYARITENIGATLVTSGPGATNLITGIACAWFDSIPCIYISGQVNSKFTKGDKPIKQVGFQEIDIVSIVKPITKYAEMVKSAEDIKYILDKATYLAKSGRPGPVLVDIPMDIQKADIKPEELRGYTIEEKLKLDSQDVVEEKIDIYIRELKKSKRPVILVGGGIRLSKSIKLLYDLLEKLKIPVVSTWAAIDVFPTEYPLFRDLIGTYGMRGANFTIQNSDLLLALGSGFSGRQTGGMVDTFAREAKRFVVDIDTNQLKYQPVKGHVNINCDLKDFLKILKDKISDESIPDFSDWIKKTREWKEKYPACLPEYYKEKSHVHTYVFMKTLSEEAKEGDIIVGDCGGNIVPLALSFIVKKNQRVYSSWANSPMGYALASSTGACLANNSSNNVICVIGDGGMQVNIQELQTIKNYNLPIKVFIMNDRSYGIIKQYQDIYLDSRYEASGRGYSCPDFVKVSQAYGIETETISNHSELREKIRKVLSAKGAIICDVNLTPKTKLLPRLGWDTPIEDQYPYLDREEFYNNMFIEPLPNKSIEQTDLK